jgi:hypothetical protein
MTRLTTCAAAMIIAAVATPALAQPPPLDQDAWLKERAAQLPPRDQVEGWLEERARNAAVESEKQRKQDESSPWLLWLFSGGGLATLAHGLGHAFRGTDDQRCTQ